jgi:hypothetical protein
MKVGEYIRTLIAQLKEERGIDATFMEKRLVGVGYKYTIGVWSDETGANRQYSTFVLSDETFVNAEDAAIESAIKNKFDALVEEFVSS